MCHDFSQASVHPETNTGRVNNTDTLIGSIPLIMVESQEFQEFLVDFKRFFDLLDQVAGNSKPKSYSCYLYHRKHEISRK